MTIRATADAASGAGGAAVSPLAPMVPLRDRCIDAAKAVAILLVVLGHARGIPGEYTLLASSFRVQLFFFVSGWLFRAYAKPRSHRATLVRLSRTLLVPYVVFFFIAYAYWLATQHVGEKALRWGGTPWWEPLIGLVTGIGPRLYVHPAIWFLPALFTTALAYLPLHRLLADRWLVPLALLAAAAWIAWFPATGLRLPLGLDVLPVSLFFYACGAWASGAISLPGSARACVAIAAVLAVPWWFAASGNGRVDINSLTFGASEWRFFAASLLGTAIVLLLSRLLQASRAVQWIGRNTLLILCTHILVFFVLSGFASVAGLFRDGREPTVAWAIFVSAVAVAACVPLRMLFDRFAPWALGGKTPRPLPAGQAA